MKSLLFGLLFFLCLAPLQAAPQNPLLAQSPSAQENERPDKTPAALPELGAVEDRLDRLRLAAKQAGEAPEFRQRLTLNEQLKLNLERLESASTRLESLTQERQLNGEQAEQTPLAARLPEPPFGLLTYDAQLDEVQALQQTTERLLASLKVARQMQQSASERVEDAEQTLRAVKDREGDSKLEDPHRLAQLELDLARTQARLRGKRLDVLALEADLAQLRLKRAQEVAEHLAERLEYLPQEAQAKQEDLAQRTKELQDRLKQLRRDQDAVEQSWLRANQRLGQGGSQRYQKRAEALLDSRQAWRETYQTLMQQKEILLSWTHRAESAWERRFSLLAPEGDRPLGDWRSEAQDAVEDLSAHLRIERETQAQLQERLAETRDQLQTTQDEWVRTEKDNRLSALKQRSKESAQFMLALQEIQQTHQRLANEVRRAQGGLDWQAKAGAVFQVIKDWWDVELWVIDGQPVTLRKLVLSMVLVAFGLIGARWTIRVLRKRLLTRTSLDESARDAVEKGVWYLLILLVGLFSLTLVNIPLTAFTFLGGALAIGVGFGAQNLVNNFISGFIIMLERPIKLGDMIEVEGNYGVIESIGARRTQVRTLANMQILVPNSSFLEKNVVNWTLSNDMVRSSVSVGVAYGSPTRKVQECLMQVAAEHPEVLDDPPAVVLFQEFGSSSLVFSLYAAISVKNLLQRRIIESDLRFMIDQTFREAGITIAFPQLDLHVKNLPPTDSPQKN